MSYKQVIIDDLLWGSDFNGYECGYDEISVVGFYTSESLDLNILINYEDGKVLEAWSNEEE